MFKRLISTTVLSGLLFLSGCGLEMYQSGDLPSQKRLDLIKPGYERSKVIDLLGQPTFENKIGHENFFIYSRIRKESQAFWEPKEIERDLYVVSFNKSGIVQNVQHLTLDDAQNIAFDESYTRVTGKELSVMEQLVKNFGRYDAGGRDSTTRQ